MLKSLVISMNLNYVIGSIIFGIVAFFLAEPFLINISHPTRSVNFMITVLLLTLILIPGYFKMGFATGFVLTIVFIAIFAQPYGVANCLNKVKERSIKAAIENPERENWETYLNADNSLWDVEPAELKYCRMQNDLGFQLKKLIGYE